MKLNRPIQGALMALALCLISAPFLYAEISPVNVGNLSFGLYGLDDIAVSGSYVYAAVHGPGPSGLAVFDASNPSQPFDVGYRDGWDRASALTVSGTNVYVIYSDGLHILDISSPTNPAPVGLIAGEWTAVTVYGRYVYLSTAVNYSIGWVGIYDVSNPAIPVGLGSIQVDGFTLDGITRVAVSGNHAFLATTTGVFDVSDPRTPVALNPLSIFGGNDIAVSGDYAYVISNSNSFRVFSVSDPTNTACVWSSYRQPFQSRVLVSGNFAYVQLDMNTPDDIFIYDISDPTNTIIAGFVSTEYFPSAVTVSGNFIYVAAYPGLKIYSLGLPPPSLKITLTTSNTLALTWPMPTAAFAVQQNSDPKSTNWVTLTNTPVVVGSQNLVRVPAPCGTMLYRLASD